MNGTGRVYLVGAGPGAADLITVRGRHYLRSADVLLFDRLVEPELVAEAGLDAEKIFVGKAPRRPQLSQESINALIIERARVGLNVVRLKGGDPFVFGRGSEEAAALAEAGIPFEVVPGLTSAVAVPTHAGVPLTHRGIAQSFAVVTGHRAADAAAVTSRVGAVAGADTVVVLMGTGTLGEIVDVLRLRGRASSTPAALIEAGTTDRERIVIGTLDNICAKALQTSLSPPVTLVIGEVVLVRESLASTMSVCASADRWPRPHQPTGTEVEA